MPVIEKNYPGALPEGTILNERFEILETIGRGGFGTIYKVVNLINKKIYAVKEYFNHDFMFRSDRDGKEVLYNRRDQEKFEKEKKLLLSESNIVRDIGEDDSIVKIYEHFEENGTAYVVMEIVEGRTLLEAVKKDGIWEPETVIRRFKPLMLTMEKVHDKNVLHRDLSPDNIMVREDGTLCILDFGSANKYIEGENTHTRVTKENYSALELRSRSKKLGRYTDVFALCGTMYYAMTGIAPADVSTRRLLPGEMKRPSEFDIKIPEEAENILMKGLEIEPGDRIQDMETLYKAFDEIYPDLTAEEKERMRKRRRRILFAAAAAALVFIISSASLFWYNRRRIRMGMIDSLKTAVAGEDLTQSEFDDALDTVTGRIGALGGENGYLLLSREEKTAVFEVAQSSYNRIDPDWITENIICRPLNIFLYRETEKSGNYVQAGQMLQEEDVDDAYAVDEGIRIDLSASAAEKFKGAIGEKGHRLALAFDSDRYETFVTFHAVADGSSSILLLRDEEYPVPDRLLLHVLTHAPANNALDHECEKAINWEEPSASLMAGKNQVNEKELPGTTMLIYYKSLFYDPMKKGEELQFQYILKNRLDSLRIPYAIGKESFDDELYVVKVTKGALWYEEIVTLGKVLALEPGDENGASGSALVLEEIQKDPGGGTGIVTSFEDSRKKEYLEMIGKMRANGKKSAFLYLTDFSSKIPFVSCGLDEAAERLGRDGSLYFDQFLFDHTQDRAEQMADIWCDYVVASMIENPVHSYFVYDIQTMDSTQTPVVESGNAGGAHLLENPDREQVDSAVAFFDGSKEELDFSYRYNLTEFGKDQLELILNNCDPDNISEGLGRLRGILEPGHLENGAFERVSVYFKLADYGKSLYTSMKYSVENGNLQIDRFLIYGVDGEEKEKLFNSIYDRISSDEYFKKMLHKEKEELFK